MERSNQPDFVYYLNETDIRTICKLSGIQFTQHLIHNPLNETTRGPMDEVRVKNGIIGEIATHAIVKKMFPNHHVSLRPSENGKEISDVSIEVNLDEYDVDPRFAHVEVKTWRDNEWEELGRCIEPHSWWGYERKRCPIVWAVIRNVPCYEVSDRCTIVGWNFPSDFTEDIVVTKGVENH